MWSMPSWRVSLGKQGEPGKEEVKGNRHGSGSGRVIEGSGRV
jgi:hypothetical protein